MMDKENTVYKVYHEATPVVVAQGIPLETHAYHVDPSASESRRGKCFNLFHGMLIGVNMLLAVVSGIYLLFLLLSLIKYGDSSDGEGRLRPSEVLVSIGFWVGVLGLSLLGVHALRGNNPCMHTVYFLCLVVGFLSALALSLCYPILLLQESLLRHNWERIATEAPQDICEVEVRLRCSGWETRCGQQVPSNSCPVCSPSQQEAINTFDQTCEAVLHDFKDVAKVSLAVGLPVGALTLVGMVVTCQLRRRAKREAVRGAPYFLMEEGSG
ncbi:hypothetical protein DQ04_06541000 [Trypanosoma grayi]|uniref:hypothetical protein n=1 Tax=Trypanosoma grayi TaxID=71804 RepID=UPI0004F465C8|nr:hypothetical protein DQ04_06541000 [Trypanosoma grayi]KEG08735.1 hypothetical protein DQ04_06541000 [Trypanosoma grayi]